MFIKRMLSYLLGYVTISVEGYFIERFINICISKNIFLWNLKRKKSSYLMANIQMKDFKELKEIARKTKCRVKIDTKKGMPFFLHRYQKRKIFLVFLAIVIVFIMAISNFVWNIEVVGNEAIPKEELMEAIQKSGLKIGTLKTKIDTKTIINTIRLERNDIAWIGIKMQGTNVRVEVVEADQKPEMINEEEYCNIISNQEAMITKVQVENGTALVKQGDIVKKR